MEAAFAGAGLQTGDHQCHADRAQPFFDCMHWQDCRVKTLELQRRLFRSADRDLTRSEYISLIETARQCDKDRTYLLVKVFALLEPAL
ncbi:MAG: hypothetical protein ACLTWR_05535 [Agathobaculum desmolans]